MSNSNQKSRVIALGLLAVVLGLDLAKDETGFCMLEVGSYQDWERVRWLGSGVFVMPSKNDKWLFSGKEGLLRGIGSLVEDLQGQGKDVVCVLETPVFGGSRSEQQFYLNQEVLWLLKGYGVDVVGFNPLQLKGFVKGLIPEGAVELMPDRLNKGHLARVYEEWVRPLNEWLPRNKVEKGHLRLRVLSGRILSGHCYCLSKVTRPSPPQT